MDAPEEAAPPGWAFERRLWAAGHAAVAGIDEAGRGALAGPIVAAAVVLPYGPHPYRDSKTVTARRRVAWAASIRATAIAWGVGFVDAADVDALGVPDATREAARRALAAFPRPPTALVTDHLTLPGPWTVLAPPRADGASLQAAAASVLAKTARDRWMAEVAEARWPAYGFARHKGYGVAAHLEALRTHGPCEVHRRRFAPVARMPPFSGAESGRGA
ncbi:MAG: ribonuclease HII [Trueperaceae bacterium]|nr:ribonuclease HII [Trueperaceae bacterium]